MSYNLKAFSDPEDLMAFLNRQFLKTAENFGAVLNGGMRDKQGSEALLCFPGIFDRQLWSRLVMNDWVERSEEGHAKSQIVKLLETHFPGLTRVFMASQDSDSIVLPIRPDPVQPIDYFEGLAELEGFQRIAAQCKKLNLNMMPLLFYAEDEKFGIGLVIASKDQSPLLYKVNFHSQGTGAPRPN